MIWDNNKYHFQQQPCETQQILIKSHTLKTNQICQDKKS